MTLFEERPMTHKAAEKTFSDRVVALALKVPKGRVTTYGALAKAAGGGGMAARSVTGILSKAWDAGHRSTGSRQGKSIPFHRIVYSDGRVWINEHHRKQRIALYKKEGIKLDKYNRIVDFADKLYEF